MRATLCFAGISLSLLAVSIFPAARADNRMKEPARHYRILASTTQGNLTVFPVAAATTFDTSQLLTLDEGIRSGKVTVTESSQTAGLVRPRRGVWSERPQPILQTGARVNELSLINDSDRPLILLAGEIVTGGKQDRVVSRDRIIAPHSAPVSLSVFCVEPHRWVESSAHFGSPQAFMAQPSVRSKAMAARNQQEVWNEVAKSRVSVMALAAPADALAIQSTSSYAGAMQNGSVGRKLDRVAAPIEHSYEKLIEQLRNEKAVGAVVAVDNNIIWADVFASPSLLEKYWPKLIRSYAAESLTSHANPFRKLDQSAQDFLDQLHANHENIESEPGLYRNTEIEGDDFEAFVLTSLLPNTGFDVHIAKMKR